MGRKRGVDTAIAIGRAFVDRRIGRHGELARRVGVTAPALREHLVALRERAPVSVGDGRAPPDAFWGVPKAWHPSGVGMVGAEVALFVAGLGDAARLETADLERSIRQFALGTLGMTSDRAATARCVNVSKQSSLRRVMSHP